MMKKIIATIAYLTRDKDNEACIRQDLKVRGFDSKQIEKLIATSSEIRRNSFKLGRMLTNIGIRTDLGVSDMLTYAFVADNMISVEAYLEASKNQDAESVEMIAHTLASAGIPDAKSVGRIVNDIRSTNCKAHRRRKDKRARKAAPHRDPNFNDEELDDIELDDSDEDADFDAEATMVDGEQTTVSAAV